jgi:uncharacterized OB-fold protein
MKQAVPAGAAGVADPLAVFLAGDALRVDNGAPSLIGGKCADCGLETFPRYAVCPGCISEEIATQEMPTSGVVYSLSTVHVGPARWHKPLTIGYVDLTNAVRVFSHLRGSCKIGDRVTLDVAEVGREKDGTPIANFVFKLAER